MKIKLLFAGLFVGILLLVSGCLQELQRPPSMEPQGFGLPLPNNASEVPQKIKDIYLETLKDHPKAELSACIGKGETYGLALIYSISESYGFSAWYAYYTINGNLITNGSFSDVQTYTVDGKPSFSSTKIPETGECKNIDMTNTSEVRTNTNDLPKNVSDKFDSLKNEYGTRETFRGIILNSCNRNNETLYVVAASDKFSGDFVYYDKDGKLVSSEYYSDMGYGNDSRPNRIYLTNHTCTTIKEELGTFGNPFTEPPVAN
ncbi:MAG: hypothetical protein Q7S22_05020 [Candidatus Micrarchaeota archaeon]|nr:hypothetical protein [Candidatus Micrarchaeota archaeon]